ncbi:hypothetical protein INR76_09565 [Marixanthomonas sp. SCSIO 43207]|uniref:hypothetical protein n=1 Tax=Marixanthomonas sp. SCSIO 43207 TaxID=2779360 RepID=UPI001CA8968D|nr:hypothetical protein [Marixanthomonas sp. SCSIO 43207]UAB80364.1 hypothetical protein INR76_09565 [Marixanthomonas sp. SCSIO 43207]
MAKPAKCISVDSARELQDNWVNTRAVEIEQAQGSVDTREFFYSVEELQEYLDYVKDMSTKQGITNPGIRIYFAAYDTQSDDKATIFLAPTNGNTSSSSNNYSIDPLNKGMGGWPPTNY